VLRGTQLHIRERKQKKMQRCVKRTQGGLASLRRLWNNRARSFCACLCDLSRWTVVHHGCTNSFFFAHRLSLVGQASTD
jgi:hypothetical protein